MEEGDILVLESREIASGMLLLNLRVLTEHRRGSPVIHLKTTKPID